MKFTDENESNFFLAVFSSIFTFCFIFLGVRLSFLYYFVGFACLFASIVYWVKVKKGYSEED